MDVRKKVLFVSYDGMTDSLGQSQVIPYLRELVKAGYDLTLLSVEKKDRLEKSGKLIAGLLTTAGIRWKTLLFTTKPPVLSKMYDQWQLNKKVAALHKEYNFDMLHCRSYVAAAAGLKLLQHSGVPYLFDMRGFWVDERVDSGLWNLKNPLYKFFYTVYKKKEKSYFSNAAHVISLTERGKEELVKNYAVAAEKISVIPCCADLDHFDYRKISNGEMEAARERLGINKTANVISYLGSLGGWYMTDEMLDFFAILIKKIPESIFLFITNDDKEKILNRAVQKGIDPTTIKVQPASRNEVPLFLSVSNWSIFFIKNLYSKIASSPTKQGEIMAMGIPIICNDIGDTGYIVKQTKAGIVPDEFTTMAYEKAINDLQQLHASPPVIREGAYAYYDLQKGVLEYRQAYKRILS